MQTDEKPCWITSNLWDRQSILRGKLRVNVATRVVYNQWVVLKPQKETLFKLTTEWKLDWGRRAAHLEARDPPRNGAIRDLEQINALYFRCDHEQPCLTSGASVFRIPTVCEALDEEHKLHVQ
jgi:hypothetical protein